MPRHQELVQWLDRVRKQENRHQSTDSKLDKSVVGSSAVFVVVVVVVVAIAVTVGIADVVNSLWLQQSSFAFLSLF